MFPKSFVVFLSICLATHFCWSPIACGWQAAAPNITDGFTASTPVMTFVDPASGQPYGRYIIQESVPVVAYSYQEVKERVFVPKTVTENKTNTVTQYVPIYSQQLQLQNVNSWNPFASPQQVWRYVPIVQYQPNYLQVTQPVTYQKYEEQEVSRMVPVLNSQSKQVPRFVDRPIGQSMNGGNTIANNSSVNNSIANNPNLVQQAAQIAQANRNTSRFPTRPIDYPYNPGYGANPGYQAAQNRNWLAQAPTPYYPNPNYPSPNYPSNPMIAGLSQQLPNANYPASGTNMVFPAVPLRPDPNFVAVPNQVYPYANTASRPLFNWPNFASGTGTLFGNSLFSSNETPSKRKPSSASASASSSSSTGLASKCATASCQ